MSKCREVLLSGTALIALAGPAAAEPLGLGREATPEEVAAWDIDVRPDGQGLPPGEGDIATGDEIYAERCASCHGVFGEGQGRWPVLMGGEGTLDRTRPVKTIGSYWPYASIVWDYVHRAMPFGDAQSLSDDETYAVAAYLLYLNDIVGADFVATPETFAAVTMPNADGFYPDDREETELPKFSGEVCMTDCKESVEIAMRAAVLDVTPEGTDAEAEAAPAERDTAAADPALVAEGEALFRQCRACHQIGDGAANGAGPHLNGIAGRPAAGVEGFRYSAAMQEAGEGGLVWNASSLTGFLSDPRGYLPGTKMAFRGLEAAEAEAMAAYLASLDGESRGPGLRTHPRIACPPEPPSRVWMPEGAGRHRQGRGPRAPRRLKPVWRSLTATAGTLFPASTRRRLRRTGETGTENRSEGSVSHGRGRISPAD